MWTLTSWVNSTHTHTKCWVTVATQETQEGGGGGNYSGCSYCLVWVFQLLRCVCVCLYLRSVCLCMSMWVWLRSSTLVVRSRLWLIVCLRERWVTFQVCLSFPAKTSVCSFSTPTGVLHSSSFSPTILPPPPSLLGLHSISLDLWPSAPVDSRGQD